MTDKVPQVQAQVPPDTLDKIHLKAHELEPTKPGEAEPLFRQVLEGYQKTYGPDGPLTIDVTRDIAALLEMTGRATEAEPIFRGLLKRQRAQVPIDLLSLANTLNFMGIGLLARHRWIEAEASFREALEIRENKRTRRMVHIRYALAARRQPAGPEKIRRGRAADRLGLRGHESSRGHYSLVPQAHPLGRSRSGDKALRGLGEARKGRRMACQVGETRRLSPSPILRSCRYNRISEC